jgi:hypothetical protein
MGKNKQLIVALALSSLIGVAHADEKEELLKLKNTTVNLIKQLVKQGVLTDKMANEMIKQAETDAAKQAASARTAAPSAPATAQNAGGAASAAALGAGAAAESAESNALAAKAAIPADEIRVAYVPDFVKDEIRQQVRSELREEVVGDVMQKAKEEKWGLPEALPEWVTRFKLYGDIRLREQSSIMASDNIDNLANPYYLNYNNINTSGNPPTVNAQGGNQTNLGQAAYLNTKYNQNIARERFRLGIDANVVDNVDVGIRLTTGNTQNPVSTNQTLGNTGLGYQFAVDRAFVRYNAYDNNKYNWLTVMGGRTPNPFFTAGSELVWDEDLSFEGAALTLRQKLIGDELSDSLGGKGPSIFGTMGIFPLQAQNPLTGLTSLQKWLLGTQGGLNWEFDNQDNMTVGFSYYDYQGIRGNINQNASANACAQSSQSVIQSAPQYIQGGNTMVGLCYGSDGQYGLYGLASNYQIFDIDFLYDLALFSPVHMRFSGDFAKNLGFNSNKILNYTGITVPNQNTGWQFKVDLGWARVDQPGNWNMYTIYRYLEADAVLSSYTDSDFHLGSTNVKGWILGGNYGVLKNVWLSGRWMSADVITGPTYSMDIMQLDINTRF